MMRNGRSGRPDKLQVEKVSRSRSASPKPIENKANSNNHSNRKVFTIPKQVNQNGKAVALDSFPVQAKEAIKLLSEQNFINSSRLLLVSSKYKYAAVLEKSVNPQIIVVLYNFETVTFNSLLALICASLDTGQRVSSVACMMNYKPSGMLMVQNNAGLGILGNSIPLSPKFGPGQFFKILFDKFVDTKYPNCRLDLFAFGCQPGSYIEQLQEIIGIDVHISKELFGSDTLVDDLGEGKKVTVGEIYFKPDKLRSWSTGSYQTIDLFEKIRMVGKGNFGTAVLYKKKDDNSLVVLKEINMTELNSQERLMAINEVHELLTIQCVTQKTLTTNVFLHRSVVRSNGIVVLVSVENKIEVWICDQQKAAKVLAMLNHPNIISYYDTFEENGVLMIEMEYADDGNLAQYLSKRDLPLEEETILSMFAQIVSGISYMHKQNILHRDLKTANIFLTKDGFVKIGDFGVSKVMSSNNKVANTVLGTPYYISPEICEGKPYNEKSDIWALGCILYEMATRQRTFEGTNLPALVNKIINGQIAPIKGDYSAEFRRLVKEMLHKDPEQRPRADDLEFNRLPELRARYGNEEHFHWIPGSRGSHERKLSNEGNRSVLYLYNTSMMNISLIEGFPSKVKIRQVAVGDNHVLVVAVERVVYTWGDNSHGQLGHGHLETVSKPQPVDALKGKSIISASCGGNFSVFLSDNGIAMTCGDGRQGCLGHGDFNSATRPRLVESLLSIDVSTVACGNCHVVVLGTKGEIYSWGCGVHGRLGLGTEANVVDPTRINISQSIRDIRCGYDSTLFITEVGTLLACGNNKHNKLGLNERNGFLMAINHKLKKTEVEFRKTPTVVKSIKGLADVAAGKQHTVVLTERDHVRILGSNKEGQMGSGDNKPQSSPFLVKNIKDCEPSIIACGNTFTTVGTTNGDVLFWGTRFRQFSEPGRLLQPPTSAKAHKRSLSTASTLSIRSINSFQHDSASDSVSRSSSYQDVSVEGIDTDSQSLNQSHDTRLPESIYCPVPILNIRSSQESEEDLSAFLDNIIPFRENIFILVETNAPVVSDSLPIKEKPKKALKSRTTMHSLRVPSLHHSVGSTGSTESGEDTTTPESTDLSSTPVWLQKELEDARKDQEKRENKRHSKTPLTKTSTLAKKELLHHSSKNPTHTKTRFQRTISSAKSDSSSDSSAISLLTAESSAAHRASADPARGNATSSRRSPLPKKTNRLHPDRSPVRRSSSGKSPIRSPARLSHELDRVLQEKKKSDAMVEKLKKDHAEVLSKIQENHEKEKLEQEQKMKVEISLLKEELNLLVKRQIEGSKRSSDRTTSKICLIQ